MTDATAAGTAAHAKDVLGHPRGLVTLFFTEMWERLSYYGMRALLVLFMTDQVLNGGMGLTDTTATAIYGIYTALVYLVALPGGWVADRLLGAQKSVFYGGIVIMCGHFVLAIPSAHAFFVGLLLVVLGTGLLKPNASAVVGELYAPGDPRRDSGFSIFYMGINVGGVMGPLICGTLAQSERFGWHYGFAAAGVGMAVGLWQYRRGLDRLGDAGNAPVADAASRRAGWQRVAIGGMAAAALLTALFTGAWRPDPVVVAANTTGIITGLAVLYFAWLFMLGGLDAEEKRRVAVIVVLFLGASLFWAGFEQAGSSLTLFAERYTDRMLGDLEIPAGWFQTLNPVFIITLAPLVAAGWTALARRGADLSTPAKFGLGLVLLGAGFAVMIFAARMAAERGAVTPLWLISTYLFHTVGELALSPVGLSATTRLAPRRYVGQMMGVWFLAASLGSLLAGLLAGRLAGDSVADMPALYLQIVLTTAGAGLLMMAFAAPIRRLARGAG